MDIREIVEDKLITPARLAAAEARLQTLEAAVDRITALEQDVAHKDSVIRCYREKNYAHERLVGKLLELLKVDDLDGARDLVKYEYDGIHGPAD